MPLRETSVTVLSSDPDRNLANDEEWRAIRDAFDTVDAVIRVVPRHGPATGWAELANELSRADPPSILHYTGHGTQQSLYGHEAKKGDRSEQLWTENIIRLFEVNNNRKIRLVVLSCCDGTELASALRDSGSVDFVVAWSGSVASDATIEFSAPFYRSLALGHSIQRAWDNGRNGVDRTCKDQLERLQPVYAHPEADPKQPFFVERAARVAATTEASPIALEVLDRVTHRIRSYLRCLANMLAAFEYGGELAPASEEDYEELSETIVRYNEAIEDVQASQMEHVRCLAPYVSVALSDDLRDLLREIDVDLHAGHVYQLNKLRPYINQLQRKQVPDNEVAAIRDRIRRELRSTLRTLKARVSAMELRMNEFYERASQEVGA